MLAHLMTLLNRRHDYGLHLFLLSIDEGITGDSFAHWLRLPLPLRKTAHVCTHREAWTLRHMPEQHHMFCCRYFEKVSSHLQQSLR